MDEIGKALATYAREVADIAGSPGSTEATYYPAVQRLLTAALRARSLPFEVRVNTSQRRTTGGTDLPDLAFYDGAGDFVVVFGELKTPHDDLHDLAVSTQRDNQVGRYLARTGVVLLGNVRAFGLLAVDPAYQGDGPVPPEHRRLLEVVELWPSASALARGHAPDVEIAPALADLLETAVTEFAPIAEPESLARILARQAKRAKADLPEKFSGAVQPLLDDFAEALGLTFEGAEGEEFLRSSLIQTAFYGLFASWTLWHHSTERREFHWRDLGDYLKIPFLGALFYEFRHPVRLKELGLAPHLDRAAATLQRVDEQRFFGRFAMPHVVGGNGPGAPAADAILYFYEPFLEAFDPDLRKELGVWYTPQEIVRYQVRKVEGLLKTELDCPRGFADDRVVVLDPCCGTGAYLIEVLRCVAEQLQREGAGAALAAKLLDAFCRRILGFEILTAPFVVAQLQLYLILSELGVEPDESHRPAIFLTNALTGWDGPEQLKLQFPELQQEHDAAQRVKREAKIIVILGNPPYNRFVGAPMEEEQELADHYKGIRRNALGRQVEKTELYRRFRIRKQLLDDLYVRFFRLAEIRIGVEAEYGVVSWISNSSYLAGRSHPLMRESLLESFHTIWIDNLHGNRLASERTPWGDSCETLFNVQGGGPGIKVGTSISTFLKRKKPKSPPEATEVLVRDFWGRAHLKRQALLDALELDELPEKDRRNRAEQPEGPREYQAVTPTIKNGWKLVNMATSGGYEDWPALDELFPTSFQGVNPNRGLEGSVIATDRQELEERMRAYFAELPFEEVERRYPELVRVRARYDPRKVREALREKGFRPDQLVPYALFPLDLRFLYYETEAKFLNERRPELWENLTGNKFLIAVPHARRISECRPLVASCLFDLHLHDRGSVGFPVHAKPADGPRDLFSDQSPESQAPQANLHPGAWEALKSAWGLEGDLQGESAQRHILDLFHLVLALAHAPQYQLDHQDALAHDWIHLPIPREREQFHEIAHLGEQVGVLLDPMADTTRVLDALLGAERRDLAVPSTREKDVLRDSDLEVTISYFAAARGGWEERPPREKEPSHTAWGETTGDLYLNDTAYLANVPERVWRYELGGYPVLKKWLGYRDQKRRPGRPLTHNELDHLRGMVQRLAALLLLHEQLDAAYESSIENPFTSEELGL
jgi:hypothetical protein